MRTYTRPYVGAISPSVFAHEVFRSATEPTEDSHKQYRYVIGPFRTMRAARWLAANPLTPLQSVAQIERAARKAHANG